jgi:hypothetical protein
MKKESSEMQERKKKLLQELMDLSACGLDVALIMIERDENGARPWLEFSSSSERDCMTLMEEFKTYKAMRHNTATHSRKRTHEEAIPGLDPLMNMHGDLPLARPTSEQLPQAGFMSSSLFPVSPRSQRAYQHLTSQFDSWIEQLNSGGAGGSVTFEGSRLQAQSKGLSITVPQLRPHPILEQATSFSLNLHPASNLSSLLPPPAPLNLLSSEPNSNSGGRPSTSNSLLDGNVFGSSSLPSPNAHNLLDLGVFSSSSLGRQPSIGILGLDLPTPDSAVQKDGNGGGRAQQDVNWPGQEDEDDEQEEDVAPGIDLVVEGKAIDIEKERIIAAAEGYLPPMETSAPSFVLPPPLLVPSSDLGGSLILGISGVAVSNVGSQPAGGGDRAPSPTVPFPGFSAS